MPESKRVVVEYLYSLTIEMRKIARANELETLAHLYAMAEIEAGLLIGRDAVADKMASAR